jgi:hypothetical protein
MNERNHGLNEVVSQYLPRGTEENLRISDTGAEIQTKHPPKTYFKRYCLSQHVPCFRQRIGQSKQIHHYVRLLGRGTMLQAGRSRVRFSMSFDFFN